MSPLAPHIKYGSNTTPKKSWQGAQSESRPFHNDTMTTPPINSLRFSFTGLSIWLELEQENGDLDKAIAIAAKQVGVPPIPAPHVTAIYGIQHLLDDDVKERFQLLKSLHWPPLNVKQLYHGIELDGIQGGTMDMAWAEVTYHTSPDHEAIIDYVYNTFHNDDKTKRPWQWAPHLSLVYDNPETTKINNDLLLSISDKVPSLLLKGTRNVNAVSLWSTKGQVSEWKCLDRFQLSVDNLANCKLAM